MSLELRTRRLGSAHISSDQLRFAPRFDLPRDDRVAIMFVEYHEVLAAATGGDGETASLVRGDLTSQFNCISKNLVGLAWMLMLDWEENSRWCD